VAVLDHRQSAALPFNSFQEVVVLLEEQMQLLLKRLC
jgi:hypothetical protein